MTEYVAGFLFDPKLQNVALILKNRGPANMAGKLNAIGGHIEEDETPIQAMVREFKEETGADVTDWKQFATLGGKGWHVHFFVSIETDYETYIHSTTDEQVRWYNLNRILNDKYEHKAMRNLKWLIPLALDNDVVHAEVHDGVAQ